MESATPPSSYLSYADVRNCNDPPQAGEWAFEKNACQLKGAEKTRENFCSNNGDPFATEANDPGGSELYTSCRCLCDDGFFFSETADGKFGCITGDETTTTTTTTTLPCWKTGACTSTLTTTTTETTSTRARQCGLAQNLFMGPWSNEVGIGEPYRHDDLSACTLVHTRASCKLTCARDCNNDPECKAILAGWGEVGDNGGNKGCWRFNTTEHQPNTAPGAWTNNGNYSRHQKNVLYYSLDNTLCAPKPTKPTTATTATTAATEKPIPITTTPSSGGSTGNRSDDAKVVVIVISVGVLSVGLGIFLGLRYRARIQAMLKLKDASDDQADQELVGNTDHYASDGANAYNGKPDGFATTV